MKIIIVGADTVGSSLAEHFSALKHQISVIDRDKDVCDALNSKLDVFVVHGEGTDPGVLEEAGIASADMIVTVTPDDAANILICNFAMQNEVKRRIARIRTDVFVNESRIVDLVKTGVTSLIEPERGVVERILQYVELPGVLETANFQSNNIYLRGYRITADMPIANKTLGEIRVMSQEAPFLVVSIVRDGKNLHPAGDQKILPGDEIVAILLKESFKTFCSLINRKTSKMKKIVVSGDSLTAVHLAKALKPYAEQVVLADPDLEHGHMAASILTGIQVFHGDSTDYDVLQEINVKHAECFIAAGKDEEDNIMSCLMAKAEGAGMVIAVRDNNRYGNLFNSLGIDYIVNPRDITLNAIIEKIQTVSIGTYLKLKSSDIEVLRVTAGMGSTVVGKSLQQLDNIFKKNITIGCIIRNDEVMIPWGGTVVQEYDEILVLCRKEFVRKTYKAFHPGYEKLS